MKLPTEVELELAERYTELPFGVGLANLIALGREYYALRRRLFTALNNSESDEATVFEVRALLGVAT